MSLGLSLKASKFGSLILQFKDANLAAVLKPGGSFYYETRKAPEVQSERDVIVKIVATGLCGSDVSIDFDPIDTGESIRS